MGKHSNRHTAGNGDTHAGGNKMGKHEMGFSGQEHSEDMLDRLAEERGRTNPIHVGDLSSMDEGGY